MDQYIGPDESEVTIALGNFVMGVSLNLDLFLAKFGEAQQSISQLQDQLNSLRLDPAPVIEGFRSISAVVLRESGDITRSFASQMSAVVRLDAQCTDVVRQGSTTRLKIIKDYSLEIAKLQQARTAPSPPELHSIRGSADSSGEKSSSGLLGWFKSIGEDVGKLVQDKLFDGFYHVLAGTLLNRYGSRLGPKLQPIVRKLILGDSATEVAAGSTAAASSEGAAVAERAAVRLRIVRGGAGLSEALPSMEGVAGAEALSARAGFGGWIASGLIALLAGPLAHQKQVLDEVRQTGAGQEYSPENQVKRQTALKRSKFGQEVQTVGFEIGTDAKAVKLMPGIIKDDLHRAGSEISKWWTGIETEWQKEGRELITQVSSILSRLPGVIQSKMAGFIATAKGIGNSVIDGLIDGIELKWKDMRSSIASLAASAGAWFKEHFQVNSPSKLTIPIGEALAAGTVAGLFAFAPEIGAAIGNVADRLAARISRMASQIGDRVQPHLASALKIPAKSVGEPDSNGLQALKGIVSEKSHDAWYSKRRTEESFQQGDLMMDPEAPWATMAQTPPPSQLGHIQEILSEGAKEAHDRLAALSSQAQQLTNELQEQTQGAFVDSLDIQGRADFEKALVAGRAKAADQNPFVDKDVISAWKTAQDDRITKNAAAATSGAQDETERSKYDYQKTSYEQYRDYLNKRFAAAQKYSDQAKTLLNPEWMRLQAELGGLAEGHAGDLEDEFNRGAVSAKQYSSALQELAASGNLSKEGLHRIDQQLADLNNEMNRLPAWARKFQEPFGELPRYVQDLIEVQQRVSSMTGESVTSALDESTGKHGKGQRGGLRGFWDDFKGQMRQKAHSEIDSFIGQQAGKGANWLLGEVMGSIFGHGQSSGGGGMANPEAGGDSGGGQSQSSPAGIFDQLLGKNGMLLQGNNALKMGGYAAAGYGLYNIFQKKKKHSWLAALGAIAGGIGGFMLGGPTGAEYGFGAGSYLGGQFAAGGQMNLGKWNMVGERGPELVAPGGYVIPMRAASSRFAGAPFQGGREGDTHFHGDIHVNLPSGWRGDPDSAAWSIRQALITATGSTA